MYCSRTDVADVISMGWGREVANPPPHAGGRRLSTGSIRVASALPNEGVVVALTASEEPTATIPTNRVARPKRASARLIRISQLGGQQLGRRVARSVQHNAPSPG